MGSCVTIPENDVEEEPKPGVAYKTSIYGWGKLKYPVRKNGKILVYVQSSPHKNDDKLTSSNHKSRAVRNGLNPIPSSSSRIIPQSSSDTQNKKAAAVIQQGGRSRDRISPKPTRLTISPSSNTPITTVPSRSPSRFPNNERIANVDTRIKHTGDIPKPKPISTSLNFYGQYRCSNCNKYWRSAHSKEGVSQNCSKCGTATMPRK